MNTLLERLPNETLFQVFSYLQVRDVFRAFDGLNLRLNNLLRSMDRTLLILSPEDSYQFEDYYSSVDTLIVKENAEVIIGHFSNLRRLILHWLPGNVVDKLDLDVLPDLEYLSISLRGKYENSLIWDIPDKVFNNGFPRMQICILPEMVIKTTHQPWSNTPMITVLKMGMINLDIYRDVLIVCPNLRVFECEIDRNTDLSIDIPSHSNLRTLVIKRMQFIHRISEKYLSCLPNLHRLDLHAIEYHFSLGIFQSKFDALKLILNHHLTQLRQMNVHLTLFNGSHRYDIHPYGLRQLEENFQSKENEPYRSRLMINYGGFQDRYNFYEDNE